MQKRRVSAITSVLGAAAALAGPAALAQSSAAPAAEAPSGAIPEVTVTAQRRAENQQSVPVSIAVMTQSDLDANRVSNLDDLAAVAPGISVRPTIGGAGTTQIVSRGALSTGVIAGTDKAVAINIDGVYNGAGYGLSSDILDLERVEVLRGPQGTLFGRNTTGGALSFVTADPKGVFGFRQAVTIGNYDQFRSTTHLELPQAGPFSAYVTYMHSQRTGDIKNQQSGITFDRSAAAGFGREVSVATLGDNKSNAAHLAVKLAPNDYFTAVYKFDWARADTSASGVGFVAYDAAIAGAFGLAGINAAVAARPPLIAGDRRPDAVRNAFSVPGYMRADGHNLTATYQANEQLTFKSITAYRKESTYAASDNLGLGQLFYPGNPAPFYVQVGHTINREKQWSEEFLTTYASDALTLTAGGLYYKEDTVTGTPDGLAAAGNLFGLPLAGNVLPAGRDVSNNTTKSLAGFGQAEFHVTPKLDLTAGLRVTNDKKDGVYYNAMPLFGVPLTTTVFDYKKTNTTYLAGADYHVNDDLLTYAKYSTGYVSGGSVGGVSFSPETVRSFEAGLKSDLLDRRLRVNLAAFYAKYQGLQQPVPGSFIGRPGLSLVLVNFGTATAKGFELEATAVPVDGLTLAASVAHTNLDYTSFTPFWTNIIVGNGGTVANFPTWLRPATTVNASAAFEMEPIAAFRGARPSLRVDANYRSKAVTPGIFTPSIQPSMQSIFETGGNVITNARFSLKGIDVGAGSVEVAAWARNLLDNKGTAFGTYSVFAAATAYEPARTFGLDVLWSF